MTVTTSTHKRQAKILLTGTWLDYFGFSPETIVTVFCEGGQLILKAQGLGLDIYRQLVAEVRQRKGHLLQVFSWTRKKPETHLVLEGFWLEKQGFSIGDPILVQFEPGIIRMKHLPLADIGFSTLIQADYRRTAVQVTKRADKQIPMILFNAGWLEDYGFIAGQAATLSYESGTLGFEPCQKQKARASPRTMPEQVNVRLKRNVPQLQIAGLWLLDIDFHPGDFLIAQCRKNQLHIRRLEHHYLHF